MKVAMFVTITEVMKNMPDFKSKLAVKNGYIPIKMIGIIGQTPSTDFIKNCMSNSFIDDIKSELQPDILLYFSNYFTSSSVKDLRSLLKILVENDIIDIDFNPDENIDNIHEDYLYEIYYNRIFDIFNLDITDDSEYDFILVQEFNADDGTFTKEGKLYSFFDFWHKLITNNF